MSRTDKDRPYWVKVNDEANYTWHDHQRFGHEYYKNVAVKDKKGNIVYDEVPVYLSAATIYHDRYPLGYYRKLYSDMDYDAIFEQAKHHFYRFEFRKEILVGYKRVRRTERVLAYTVKDYCTEGEKHDRGGWHYGSELPCTPYLEVENRKKFYTSDKAKLKHTYSRKRYSHERNIARDTLKGVAKLYNSGEDVSDYDNATDLTAQHRHSMNWDLW